MFRQDDPGPCPICGAAHSACTADSGPILVAQLPARDAVLQAYAQSREPSAELAEPVMVPPEPVPFTTSDYRGMPGRKKRR